MLGLLSHWYPGSGVYLIVSIPDLCLFLTFINDIFTNPHDRFQNTVFYLKEKQAWSIADRMKDSHCLLCIGN